MHLRQDVNSLRFSLVELVVNLVDTLAAHTISPTSTVWDTLKLNLFSA